MHSELRDIQILTILQSICHLSIQVLYIDSYLRKS